MLVWFLHTFSQVTETLDLLVWILNSFEDKWIAWDWTWLHCKPCGWRCVLTLYTLTTVFIFSILFSAHLLRCQIHQSQISLADLKILTNFHHFSLLHAFLDISSNPLPAPSPPWLSTTWFEVIQKINNDVLFLVDQVFLILYKELYYRHIYHKLKVMLLTQFTLRTWLLFLPSSWNKFHCKLVVRM